MRDGSYYTGSSLLFAYLMFICSTTSVNFQYKPDLHSVLFIAVTQHYTMY